MLALPQGFTGVIHDSATSATLAALLCAREKATAWRGNEGGLPALGAEGLRLAVYCSQEAHSSIEKSLKVAGLGKSSLRKIKADSDFAMDIKALSAAISADKAQGITPCCVVASMGGTGVGAMDPIRAIGEVCQRESIWLHVDGAWAGSALLLPEERQMADGMELADSFVFNPHKWLFTNFDCSAFYVRDPEALHRTLALVPEYLKSPEGQSVTDYQNWSVPLGRRFRALKLWFVIRSYGVEGLRALLRNHISWAKALYDEVRSAPDFETLSPRHLSLFTFRYHPKNVDTEGELDDLNDRLLRQLNDSGELYLTQNRVRGRFAIRFVVGQTYTQEHHVHSAWQRIVTTAREL
jgi:aromatic-L-amino-acid decarboxylase